MADVGIVMPLYRQRPADLHAAITSVLQQSYANFRLIIVLDGAPAKEQHIARHAARHDHRVRIVSLPENRGVPHALNAGFAKLTKRRDIRYYTWVSGDNVYHADFVARLRAALVDAPPDLGLVYSGYRPIDHRGRSRLRERDAPAYLQRQEQPKENLLEWCFIGPSFMYKRTFAEKLEGYRAQPVEDYEYWLRLTEICEIQYIPEFLMDYRVAPKYSLSRQLHETPARHREWRYAFRSIQRAAYSRRGIPCETTIIVPVADLYPKLVQDYEFLLEQSYNNYRLVIIDMSHQPQVRQALCQIPDPRATYVVKPLASVQEAITGCLAATDTAFVMVYGDPSQHPLPGLGSLVRALRTAPTNITVVKSATDGAQIVAREAASWQEWRYNELYRFASMRSV